MHLFIRIKPQFLLVKTSHRSVCQKSFPKQQSKASCKCKRPHAFSHSLVTSAHTPCPSYKAFNLNAEFTCQTNNRDEDVKACHDIININILFIFPFKLVSMCLLESEFEQMTVRERRKNLVIFFLFAGFKPSYEMH